MTPNGIEVDAATPAVVDAVRDGWQRHGAALLRAAPMNPERFENPTRVRCIAFHEDGSRRKLRQRLALQGLVCDSLREPGRWQAEFGVPDARTMGETMDKLEDKRETAAIVFAAVDGAGKPDLAMAGGSDAAVLPKALASVAGWIAERA